MKILALSGWGQPHDTLSDIATSATPFDYTAYTTIDAALAAIAQEAKSYDAVVGWSLGGQLAVRATASGLMQPKKLILIAVPFQFVHGDEVKIGMPRDKFQKFRDNYSKNAQRTLAKAWELIVMNDKNPDRVRAQFVKYNQAAMLEKNWLHWLDMLDGFSCKDLDFGQFPETLLLHGVQDAVVEHTQAHEFIKVIPQAKHIIMPDSGHAPHWHDTQFVKHHIEEFLHV